MPGIQWSQNELDKLRQTYGTLSKEELLALFPGRTYPALKSLACRIAITTDQQWTESEINILRQNGGTIPVSKIALLLPGRAAASITKMMSELKIQGLSGGFHAGRRNAYTVDSDKATIYIKRKSGEVLSCYVSLDKIESVLNFGRWYTTAHKTHPYARCKKGDKAIYMTHFLIGCPNGFEVDHINGNTLDNRTDNLRTVTKSKNMINITKQPRSKTGIRCLYWVEPKKRWMVTFTRNFKRTTKMFRDFEEAKSFALKIESLRVS